MSPQLLPDLIVSGSDCLVNIFPAFWALPRMVDIREEERKQQAEKFGLSNQSLEKLIDWTTKCSEGDEIGDLGGVYQP